MLCQRNGSWSNKTQTGSKTSNTISVVILFVKRPNDQIILNDSTRNMLLCIKSHRNIDEHFQYLLKWTIKLNNASIVCLCESQGKFSFKWTVWREQQNCKWLRTYSPDLLLQKRAKLHFMKNNEGFYLCFEQYVEPNIFVDVLERERQKTRKREVERWRAWHHSFIGHCIDNAFHY